MDKVFNRLASKYKATIRTTRNGNSYFDANGYRVTIYNSSSGAGRSLGINYNSGEKVYKIRLMDNLSK